MIVFYYEVRRGKKTPRYFRRPYPKDGVGPLRLGFSADRIWQWDSETDSVHFVKNQLDGTSSTVDKSEFILVQCAAQEYKHGMPL
jgi:hypothetical protein